MRVAFLQPAVMLWFPDVVQPLKSGGLGVDLIFDV